MAAPKCPLLADASKQMWWMRYEPTQVGNDSETGEPIFTSEFVPHRGPRKDFLEEFVEKLEQYMPHIQDNKIQRNNLRLSLDHVVAEKDAPTVAITNSDYAAQFETIRWTNPTCAVRQAQNNCVMMITCKPEEVTKTVRKWGKRKETCESWELFERRGSEGAREGERGRG